MILYIYKTNDEFSNIMLKNRLPNLSIASNEEEISGFIKFESFKVKFILKIMTNFLFLFAESKYEKRKAFNILYELSNETLTYFKPDPLKEYNLISSSNDKIIKFIHDNKLVHNKTLTKNYCDKKLANDYYIYESKITFEKEKNKYEFLYYGDAIKIKTEDDNYINQVILYFENKMGD